MNKATAPFRSIWTWTVLGLLVGCGGNDGAGFQQSDASPSTTPQPPDPLGDDDSTSPSDPLTPQPIGDDDSTSGDDDSPYDEETPAPTYTFGDGIEQTDSLAPYCFCELLDAETVGNYLYLVGQGGIVVMDISDPEHPTYVSGHNDSERYYRFKADEDYLLVSHRDRGLTLVSVADPGALYDASEGFRPTDSTAFEGVDRVGTILYGAAHAEGLYVIEWGGEGGGFQTLSHVEGFDNAWEVVVREDYAYVADGESGLKIVDVSNPSDATIVGALDLDGVAQDIVLGEEENEGIAFVALGSEGVAIVDIDDPTNPLFITAFRGRGTAYSLDYEDSYLFIGSWTNIDAVDVSIVDLPVQAATQPPVQSAMAVTARDGMIYVADWGEVSSHRFHEDRRSPEIYLGQSSISIPEDEPGQSVYEAIVVYNDGPFPLEISRIDADSTECSYGDGAFEVEAYGSAIVEVECLTTDYPYVLHMSIYSNDPDEEVKSFEVSYAQDGVEPGNDAPNFYLQDLEGYQHVQEEYEAGGTQGGEEGKVIMISFFATY